MEDKKYEIVQVLRINKTNITWLLKDKQNKQYEGQIITFSPLEKQKYTKYIQKYNYLAKENTEIQKIIEIEKLNEYQMLIIYEYNDLQNLNNTCFKSPEKIKTFAIALIDTIEKIHSKHLYHGDLQAENILVTKTMTPKIVGINPLINIENDNELNTQTLFEKDIQSLEKIIHDLKNQYENLKTNETNNSSYLEEKTYKNEEVDYINKTEEKYDEETENFDITKEVDAIFSDEDNTSNSEKIFKNTKSINIENPSRNNIKIFKPFIFLIGILSFIMIGYTSYSHIFNGKIEQENYNSNNKHKEKTLNANSNYPTDLTSTQKQNLNANNKQTNNEIQTKIQKLLNQKTTGIINTNMKEIEKLYSNNPTEKENKIKLLDQILDNKIRIANFKYKLSNILYAEQQHSQTTVQYNAILEKIILTHNGKEKECQEKILNSETIKTDEKMNKILLDDQEIEKCLNQIITENK